MKVQGFFKDVGGAGRVTERRRQNIANAGTNIIRRDPINEVALALHPGTIKLKVAKICEVSPTAKTFRFVAQDGHLPVFQAGQYMSLNFKIGDTVTTRPYSISSAPFETRGKNSFFEITVRAKGDTFVPEYLFHDVQVGTEFTGSLPHGQFYYEPLRDAKHVVALAGGSGITPFYSMAREIAYGKPDCDLKIVYGSAKSDDIILKDALEGLNCPRVQVIHVLSDEQDWQGEKGFLTRAIIKKYSADDTSYFICGPQVMYRFVEKELEALKIPRRRIRREVFGVSRSIASFPGFPQESVGKTYSIIVVRGIHEDVISAKAEEPVAVAIERAGIKVDTKCRSGECGFCRSQLLFGNVFVCPDGDGRRLMDRELGFIHPCSAYPTSDLKIKIPIL